MTLLFTGASGFVGDNILPILRNNYTVSTLGYSNKDDYYIDLAISVPELTYPVDIVLHAAGKAHSIPKNELENKLFFDINLQGTKNLCYALERVGTPKSFIFISTVAVYGCNSGVNISESHPLNGTTPYALSKLEAERFLLEWCKCHNVKLSILRPSLIAGSNSPGNLGAMVKGIKTNRYFSIGNGAAKKAF